MFRQKKVAFLMCLVFLGLTSIAQVVEVVVEIPTGETVFVDVDQEDTILDLQSSIEECLDVPIEHQEILVKGFDQDYKKYDFNKTSKRDYHAKVTRNEKRDISFIVKTLAEKGLLTLWNYEDSLKKAGDRINHVHPLRFLMCVFTDPELKKGIAAIQKRGGWVWGDFIDGLSESLDEESQRNNMREEFVRDFSETIHVKSDLTMADVRRRNWKNFVSNLIKRVP